MSIMKQRELKQRLKDKRLNVVSSAWIIDGSKIEAKTRRRIITNEKMADRLKRIEAISFAAKKRRRNMKSYKEGNNATIFFNKRRKHAVKVFGIGSVGDHYSRTRTFNQNLSYCLARIKGRTISEIDLEIKRFRERLLRIKSKKIDPSIFHPNPKEIINNLVQEKRTILKMQKEILKDTFWKSKSLNKNYVPFVYSIKTPKIFSEHRLKTGEYVVSMEYVKGPNLSEMLEALERNPTTIEGKNALDFLKKNQLNKGETRTKIVEINKAITDSALKNSQYTQTPFVPRLDSFIVEGIDRHGNFKLVLVDSS